MACDSCFVEILWSGHIFIDGRNQHGYCKGEDEIAVGLQHGRRVGRVVLLDEFHLHLFKHITKIKIHDKNIKKQRFLMFLSFISMFVFARTMFRHELLRDQKVGS